MIDLKKIKRLRIETGISQKQMSESLGFCSQQAYYMKESGNRDITANELGIIATVLGVPVGDLYTADGDADETAAITGTPTVNHNESPP